MLIPSLTGVLSESKIKSESLSEMNIGSNSNLKVSELSLEFFSNLFVT